jgi:cyclopropane-fatty-acyl-phospholipid synthase
MNLIRLAEKSVLPDWAIRMGIRYLLARRIRQERRVDVAAKRQHLAEFVRELENGPLAVSTDLANEQHYEVPAEFFQRVLGPNLKYSCCLWPDGCTSLADAEAEMLELTCRRAEIQDGMRVLELGCGWGSLTLWIARHFPACHVTAVSNSHSQRQFIETQCRERTLTNVEVITADICEFDIDRRFDRVVSLEMFEHLRNYALLFRRVSGWLEDEGKLFFHIFCHRNAPYFFDTEGSADWMGRHFFSGGMMPSDDLPLYFQDHLAIQQHWRVGGRHYAQTCDAWLATLDENRAEVIATFERLLGKKEAPVVVQRWRMFFMACAELFRYRRGNEWFVSHYLFANRVRTGRTRHEAPRGEASHVGSNFV